MEQVRLAVNSHSRPLLIQKRRSQKMRWRPYQGATSFDILPNGRYSLIVLPLDSKVRQICIDSLPVRILPHFRYLLQVRLHRRKAIFR